MSRRPKIILTGSLPPPYHGSSIYFKNLLNSEIRNAFDVIHHDISDHRDLENLSRLDFTNVKIALGAIFNLRKKVRKEKPDLVYIPVASNFLPYLRDGLLILTASAFSNAKIIIHLHEGKFFRDTFYNNSNFLVRKFIRHSLSKTDRAIVLGKSLCSVFEGLVDKIEVCPNGVADEFGPVNLKSRNDSKIIISYLGNLFESKGVIDVLSAAAVILREYTNVEFHFAGGWKDKNGNAQKKALEIIQENKIGDKIKFHGVITGDEKKEFLSNSDIVVFPTWYPHEGFPLVIIEAMSAGKPVVSSKGIGAISDIVVENETGLLIEKKNISSIAGAIMKLINNNELRKQMGLNARKKFEELYTLDKNIKSMISIFNDTLK